MSEFNFNEELDAFPADVAVGTYQKTTKGSSPKPATSPGVADGSDRDEEGKGDGALSVLLKGKTVVISIDGEKAKDLPEVKSRLERMGAKVVSKVTKQVQFVVYSHGKKDLFQQARKNSIPIVNLAWTEKCFEEKKLLEVDDYLVSSQATLSQPGKEEAQKDVTADAEATGKQKGKAAASNKPKKSTRGGNSAAEKDDARDAKDESNEEDAESKAKKQKPEECKKDITPEKKKAETDDSKKPEKSTLSTKSSLKGLKKLVKKDGDEQEKTEKAGKKDEGKGKKSGKVSKPAKKAATKKRAAPKKKGSDDEAEVGSGPESDGEGADEGFRESQLSDDSSLSPSEAGSVIRTLSTKSNRKVVNPKEYLTKAEGPRIAISGLDATEKSVLSDVVKSLGGKVSDRIDSSTTHLVTAPKRTIKVLTAAAQGIWLLQPSWIFASLEEGKWAAEQSHEVDFLAGPRLLRLRRESGKEGLLWGKSVVVIGETNPDSQSLEDLVFACEGEIAEYVTDCKLCIAAESTPIPEDFAGIPVVTEKYLLDSIAQGTLLPMKDYRHPGWTDPKPEPSAE